tara:strand:- start:33093 stop:33626 length:534 start_codon:yes stop_codon:yes gene_type:complete
MLDTLITSKTRLKLLLKFFLNPDSKGYLRSLESEFGESTNGIRLELNRFESAGMLVSELDGNKKVFQANSAHPLFLQLQKIVQNYIGLDQIIETVVLKLGDVQFVYLMGKFARGLDAKIIDLVFVGDVDEVYLKKLVIKAEGMISRKITYSVVSTLSENSDVGLLLWCKEINKMDGH